MTLEDVRRRNRQRFLMRKKADIQGEIFKKNGEGFERRFEAEYMDYADLCL
ncbi:hypothetical protein HanRHA438_Chr01g0010371 [Helianthus annuus]|nr:hypothetical protein HanRHA438_Chr01g0010371 [Helianthus annuus]